MESFRTVETPANTSIPIGMKLSVTAGHVRRFLVGSPEVQVFEVLAGRMLDRIAAAGELLKPGEVGVGSEALGQFGPNITIDEWRSGPGDEHYAIVTDLTGAAPASPWPEFPELPPEKARQWLPPNAYERLEGAGGEFLAELRPVAALLLSFTGIDYDTDEAAETKLCEYIAWVQGVVLRYGGHLLELTMGDKGSYCYAVFGALVSHENDSARAVRSALELRSPPAIFGHIHEVKIGISLGTLYAGAYGDPTRRTFGVQGRETSIAARLMGAAEEGQILVTSHLAVTAGDEFEYRALESMHFKGLTDPLPVLAVERRHPREVAALLRRRSSTPMVGREQELSLLAEQIHALQTGRSGIVIIEGEAGIGKTRLLEEFLEQASRATVPILVGAGDVIEQSTAYYAWGPIYREILGIGRNDDSNTIQDKALSRLPPGGDGALLAPLLNPVLQANFPETELTAQMQGEARANSTRTLLVNLLSDHFGTSSGLLMTIEDAQWLDSASWALLEEVRHALSKLLLTIVTRPMTNGGVTHGEVDRMLSSPDVCHLRLTNLTAAETSLLVGNSLGSIDLPSPLASWVYEHSGGQPFFSEQVAFALRDGGYARVEKGKITLVDEERDLHDLGFPMTVQGVITSRIDRLDSHEQLALKVASVIGGTFGFDLLFDIYPIREEKDHLLRHLSTLERLNIIRREAQEAGTSFAFMHTITRDVVYDLMPSAQQRQLHRAVAEWYESKSADDLTPLYSLLAHHWTNAGDTPKAIAYSEQAGEHALKSFANEEAVSFFTQALKLDEQAGFVTDRRLRARWELQIGEAYVHWTHYAEGRDHLEEGLRLLGRSAISSRPGLFRAFNVLGSIVIQLTHRLKTAASRDMSPDKRGDLLAASRAFSRLVEVYYHTGAILESIHASFHTLNLAEQAGESPELAEAYAPIAVFFSFLRMHRATELYFQLALETAKKVNNLAALSYVQLVKCTYETGVGHWREAHELSEQLREIGKRLGARRRYNDGLQLMTIVLYFQGQFTACLETAEELLASARTLHDLRFEGYGLFARAYCRLYLGRAQETLADLDQLQALFDGRPGVKDEQLEMIMYGLRGLALLKLGENAAALIAADRAGKLSSGAFQASYYVLPGYAGPAEVYLALYEQDRGNIEMKHSARKALKGLGRFAATFPIGRPRVGLLRGIEAWLDGRSRVAIRSWDAALNAALQLGMPYEAGRIQLELGERPPADPQTRARRLEAARESFRLTGCIDELKRVEAGMSNLRAQASDIS